jgi:hypothetical protein
VLVFMLVFILVFMLVFTLTLSLIFTFKYMEMEHVQGARDKSGIILKHDSCI